MATSPTPSAWAVGIAALVVVVAWQYPKGRPWILLFGVVVILGLLLTRGQLIINQIQKIGRGG